MTFRNSGALRLCLADVNTVLHIQLCSRLLCKAQVVNACRAYKLGKRRWSYNQCELVLHQDDDCGLGVVLAAAGAVYKKKSDLEELCTDPESQVCDLSNTALPITQLTPAMLAINVHAVCKNTLQFIHIRQHAYGA